MGSKGIKGFDTYYAEIYGERWGVLREALSAPVQHVLRINAFADPTVVDKRFTATQRKHWAGVSWIVEEPLHQSQSQPQLDSRALADIYKMDLASIFPAIALDVKPGDRVLDMCAAPGGKTLILAEALKDQGELIANEISDNRRSRLARVLREHLPKEIFSRVKVKGHDAARWCLHEKNVYDKILLDAPCSGERHLLEDPSEMKTWSEARSKNLSVRQYTLLASAIQAVKPGGRIVYSTCSLSPRENDDVIARLLKRREGEARVLTGRGAAEAPPLYPPPIGEPTDYGWMILPDKTGYGPIYYSVVERL